MTPAESLGEAQRALIASVVRLALTEDLGTGDISTLATVAPEDRARARVIARQAGVFSGQVAAEEVARAVDPSVVLTFFRHDGQRLAAGGEAILLEGPARSLLSMERVLLNFVQRLSGVATLTSLYVEAVRGTGVRIADTRKTTPGLRLLEKAAVRHGGGLNHRMGLFDAFMIKDNHIAAAGGITRAVERVRSAGLALRLTVEAQTVEEAAEAARLGVNQILLDNMEPETVRAAVDTIRAIDQGSAVPVTIEVSGGVTLESVARKALPGVDLISVGALTHSAIALDISLDL